MHNAVIALICDELVQRGITALRFNFRGVEGSQGTYDEGVGEISDVRAALNFLCSLPASPTACALPFSEEGSLGLSGYSFGAYVAAKEATEDGRVKGIALISPAVGHQDFDFFVGFKKPKLLMCGERDDLVPSDKFLDLAQRLAEPKQIEHVPFADHFWSGFERLVANKVAKFFEDTFD
jgi:alpha/beta superfamily hydrolase